jgi:ribosomal protein L29
MALRKKEATVVKKVSARDVKKTAEKVASTVSDTARDLRTLTEQQLRTALKTTKEDLLAAQKMLRAKELPSSHVIKKTKKQIARIYLVIEEKSKEEKEKK